MMKIRWGLGLMVLGVGLDLAAKPHASHLEQNFIEARSYSHLAGKANAQVVLATRKGTDFLHQFKTDPVVYDLGSTKVFVFAREFEGIPVEDSMRVVQRSAGQPDREWIEGLAPIHGRLPALSYADGWHEVKAHPDFNASRDINLSNALSRDRVYQFDPHDKTYHLVYKYLFQSSKFRGVMVAAVDAHTGKLREFRLNRHEMMPVRLTSSIFADHPLSQTLVRGLPRATLQGTGKGAQALGQTDFDGNVDLPDMISEFDLMFKNGLVDVGHSSSDSWSALPINTYAARIQKSKLSVGDNDLSKLLNISAVMPFVYLQEAQASILSLTGQNVLTRHVPVAVDYDDFYGCNAYFSAGYSDVEPPHLVFYGPKNNECLASSQFSSIVMHEFGHYIDHFYSGISDSASSEGFGDIMSLLYVKNPILAENFLAGTINHYIRDLRINRHYENSRGQVHFQGQVVASAFWDLIQHWNSIFSEEWVFETLKQTFIKALTITPNMYKLAENMASMVQSTYTQAENSYLTCSLHKVFSDFGISTMPQPCQDKTAQIQVEVDEQAFEGEGGGRVLTAGSRLPVHVQLSFPESNVPDQGYLSLTLWMGDQMVSKVLHKVENLQAVNHLKNEFEIDLPAQVTKDQQYRLQVTFTDRAVFFAWNQQDLPIERRWVKKVEISGNVDKDVAGRTSLRIPFKLSESGFIEGPVKVAFQVSSSTNSERIWVSLRASNDKMEDLTVHPPSLTYISDKPISIPYTFQGYSASDPMYVVVSNYGSTDSKVRVGRVKVEANVFE
jgi:hypothetical protein